MPTQLPLIVIAGPTGAGKSALALELAREFGGEIVNCDSLQLYRGLDIGTAKTPPAARGGIAHHLLDVLDPGEVYSAGDYAQRAREVLAGISARGRLPIVVGGTGFYLRALLDGLPPLPPRDALVRAKLAAREQRRPGALHRLLHRLDPAAASRIHSKDTQKLTRALEVRLVTRNPMPPATAAEPLRGYRPLKIGLHPDRARLYEILDARARQMFQSGLVEEVKAWLARGATGREKAFESLGYRQAVSLLRGAVTLDQAIASTQAETRQYAKRQMTWFRRDPEIVWLDVFGGSPEARAAAFDLVRKFLSSLPLH